jgi:hypothetical protein
MWLAKKLTFYQNDRKKGGEGGETGVDVTIIFGVTPLLSVLPPFSEHDWESGGGVFLSHFFKSPD